MDRIVDTEGLPDQESLIPFREGDNNKAGRKPLEVWRKLDLTVDKVREVVAWRGQQEAIRKLVKDGLAQKLLSFFIVYVVTCLIVMFLRALVSRYVPGFKSPSAFLVFVGSHTIYLGFLMLLSLSYGLYAEWGWRIALAVVLLVVALPLVYKWMVAPGSLTLVVFSVVGVFAITSIRQTRLWKRLRSRFIDERQSNINNNQDRAAFRMEVEGFLRTVDEESSNRLQRGRTFKWLRGRVVRASVDVLYLILTRPGFANPKEALEGYVKRHRFKDSMGRLATVVWVAGALAYLIFPDSVWAGEASLVAVNVLPVYVATMFIMERLDEAREEVFEELAGLIGPDGPIAEMRSST